MAMQPFIGYNVKDYLAHWLKMGGDRGGCAAGSSTPRMPKIFHVNWFQQNAQGNFRWPGFGENIRVLEWILNRVDKKVKAVQTPIGYVPHPDALNLTGIKGFDPAELPELLKVDKVAWQKELTDIKAYYKRLVDTDPDTELPEGLQQELDSLVKRCKI